jgi:hypothetical protein
VIAGARDHRPPKLPAGVFGLLPHGTAFGSTASYTATTLMCEAAAGCPLELIRLSQEDTLNLPPLERDPDSPYWIGHVAVMWYRTEEPPRLTVMSPDGADGAEARPSPAQLAAFEHLMGGGPPLRGPILEQFRRYVPELATGDWAGLEAFFRLTDVRLFPVEKGGLSYVGLVFSCLQWDGGYEHGAGIIVHGERVVHFGAADEAKTGERAYIDAGLLEPDEGENEEVVEG